MPSAVLSNRQIARAALTILLGFLASGVLGLVRTALIGGAFGASSALDAFYAAQRLPELIFVLVAGGALGSSFMPVFTRFLRDEDDERAWRLASASITLSSLAAAVLSLGIVLFAPWIVQLLVPGRPPVFQQLTLSLMRIMMLTPFIFSISGLLMGVLQTYDNFVLPSLAISMNNVGLIIGALALVYVIPAMPGSPAQVGNANIFGLAWGAVLSALLHLAVQLPGLRLIQSPSARIHFLPDWRVPGIREVLLMMGPRVVGLGVAQLNFIVNVNFASRMMEGSQSVLTTAWVLMFTMLGIIGQSVGAALFPTLSALAADGNIEGYKDRLSHALRSVLFLAIPATVGLMVLGQPLIGLLLERREWTAEMTAGTAWALSFFALGIAGHAGLEVLSRAFYALSDTRTPVLVGIFSLIGNIILSAIFIRVIGDPTRLARGPFAGLALANSVTTLLEALALWWLLRRRIGDLNDRYLLVGVLRTAGASLVMLVALLVLYALMDGRWPMGVIGILGVGSGGLVYLGASLALKLDEPLMLLQLVTRRFKRQSG
jgi:putative peptidoglycan lipid II flippase